LLDGDDLAVSARLSGLSAGAAPPPLDQDRR
jgi:hypothetical protein